MTNVCGKCIACTKFNGRNGSGYQPCHNFKRPVPPDVPIPPIKMIGGSELVDSKVSYSWLLWFFGICIGIAIGIQLAKVI